MQIGSQRARNLMDREEFGPSGIHSEFYDSESNSGEVSGSARSRYDHRLSRGDNVDQLRDSMVADFFHRVEFTLPESVFMFVMHNPKSQNRNESKVLGSSCYNLEASHFPSQGHGLLRSPA